MKRVTACMAALLTCVACSSNSDDTSGAPTSDAPPPPGAPASSSSTPPAKGGQTGGTSTPGDGPAHVDPANCPTGTTKAKMNGLDVCKTSTGVPLVEHVFVVVLENMSLDTFGEGDTPTLDKLRKDNAIAKDYHGASHPSLPNYIAMTSGDTQGIGCDCKPTTAGGLKACTNACNLFAQDCACNRNVKNIADQLEAKGLGWKAYGEGMGAACNLADDDNTGYAVRHVPFLYYDGIQGKPDRCKAHVVDLLPGGVSTAPDAPAFQFVAPNLTHDGHDPVLPGFHSTNLTNIDTFIGPFVKTITDSASFQKGGLLVIVFDEDDNSGFPTADDPIPLIVISPFAKKSYESKVKADHYTLLATIEDALALGGRLGQAGKPRAGMADTLSDFFPAQ